MVARPPHSQLKSRPARSSHPLPQQNFAPQTTSGIVCGGYVIPGHSFGQFRWNEAEKAFYGRTGATDINGLEFVTAVCAVLANREFFLGKRVLLHCDNTSAVSWLNKLSTSQLFGQAWIRVLISVLLTYDIVIHCVHIAGILNVYADALSRFLQTPATEELVSGLLNKPVLACLVV